MKRQIASRALFLAACWLAPAAFAGSDIVKCVDPAGRVTLTDEPCPSGSETTPVPAGIDAPAAASGAEPGAVTRIVTTERILPAARPAAQRHDNWVRKAGPDRALARDVATLKAARANLQSMDSGRHARLAGLN